MNTTIAIYAAPERRLADIPELATLEAARTTARANTSCIRRLREVVEIAGLNEPFQHTYVAALLTRPRTTDDLFAAYNGGGTSLALILHHLGAAFPGITVQEAAICAIEIAADQESDPTQYPTRWPALAATHPQPVGLTRFPLVLHTRQDLYDWCADNGSESAFVISGDHRPHILYSNHDGDWYALRPLDEDDLPRWPHPANPADQGVLVDADTIPLPITVVANAWA